MRNNIAVVSGASEGLGKQIALKLAKESIFTILLARTESKLQQVIKEIENQGGKAAYFVCDLTDDKQVTQTVEQILNQYQNIDILVSNAGIYFEKPTDVISMAEIKKMFAVNTLGSIAVTKACIPQFKKQNSGQILTVVSIAGLEPSGEWGLYTASKFAQTGFVESLRKELIDTKIKVMGFYPEGIDTGIFVTGGLSTKPHQSWMMSPQDVAEIVYFMLSRPDDVNLSQVVVRKIES